MVIDLTCFTTLSIPDLQRKLDCFQGRNSQVFPAPYVLYDARSLDRTRATTLRWPACRIPITIRASNRAPAAASALPLVA